MSSRVPSRFADRREAGRYLADAVAGLREHDSLLVLGIPRGGVPVAYEVAVGLGAPLDVIVVRKLGHPDQPELAIGAIASGGVLVLNPEAAAGLPQRVIEKVAEREQHELERRERAYRGGRPAVDPTGTVVVLVDDGLATGSSMRAAIRALRQRRPARIIVAVPVAPTSTAAEIGPTVDRFVCLIESDYFSAVGEWFEDFSATSDREVQELLARAAQRNLDGDAIAG
ncbi:MAG TPA: phosphoribosyltransferase [Streptosporangiaceae bacterium]|nr:phosphoribosyltransferase [Streptosporangiaceae bacterium]HVD01250.1 phosphoribosyltransferase [Candidatus Dormibacteraeota bacterium]